MVICYVDIDHFKPFNDLYGYAKGDEVLLCLAQCLRQTVDLSCDFVGHIGGDDFLLALGSADWRVRLNSLQMDFQRESRRFYRAEHLQDGCFTALNRKGRWEEYPLLSLSLGVVTLSSAACSQFDEDELAALASEAKRHAKAVPGYSLHILQAG
jgi:GGDEF domain-containing protein